jgi:hypothetical protein
MSNSMPEAKKRQETEALLKKESKFLRFLRTKETPSISRLSSSSERRPSEKQKSDGNIFGLKCLVRAEMFKRDQLGHVRRHSIRLYKTIPGLLTYRRIDYVIHSSRDKFNIIRPDSPREPSMIWGKCNQFEE